MNYFDLLVKEEKIALILDNKSYSYNKLFNDALDLSNKIKTSKKEIIAIYSDDIYFQLISFFAANRCKNVPVIFHPNLSKESIDEIMEKNNINYLLYKNEEGIKFKKVNNFENVIENEKICVGVLTSGSTGIPKVLFRTYESWTSFFPIQNEVFNITSNSKIFFNGPLSFTGNLNSILGVIYEKGTLISVSGFNPRKWLKALEEFKATNIYLVPAKLKALVQVIDSPLLFVKNIFTGSQQLFGDLSEKLRFSFKNAVVDTYEDENKGKEIIAYIVLNDEISKAEIKSKLKEKLMNSEIPKKIIFLDEIPLNDSGKVDKKLLKNKANA